ncbi:MAG TPA: dihydrofolate reductase [Candidatus Paceibacterota bacterium]
MAQEGAPRISLIAAIGARTRAIGKDNRLLWQLPEDLKRFKRITDGHPVIMGRKTWESLPDRFRPLPGRTNIVVSRQHDFAATGATVVHSLDDALAWAAAAPGAEEVFIIGGAQLYTDALPYADRLYLTSVNDDAEGDAFFPPYPDFTQIIEHAEMEGSPSSVFVILERPS